MALATVQPESVQVPIFAEGDASAPYVARITVCPTGVASELTFKCRTTIPKELKVRPASGSHASADPLPVELVFNAFSGKGKVQVQLSNAASGASETLLLRLEPAAATGSADGAEHPPQVQEAAPPAAASPAPPPAQHPVAAAEAREPAAAAGGRDADATTASPSFPAIAETSTNAGVVEKFDIEIALQEIMATSASSNKAYAVRWKRGSAAGESPIVRGHGGRVPLNTVGQLIGCKVGRKPDGTVARRLLQMTILAGNLIDVDDEEHLPDMESMSVWGTVKIDASEYVGARREAELPVKLEDGGTAVLLMSLSMSPFGSSSSPVLQDGGRGADEAAASPAQAADVPASPIDLDDGGDNDDDVMPVTTTRRRPARKPVEAPAAMEFDFAALGKAAGKNPAGAFGGAGGGEATGTLAPPPTAEQQSNVFVCVRVRPLLKRIESGDMGWRMGEDGKSLIALNDVGAQYQYDYVISPRDTNPQVFDVVGTRFVDSALSGINGTLFMYGQTASGKTHTMFGETNEAGVTQLMVKQFFDKLAEKMAATAAEGNRMKAVVQAGYFEVYNEELNDLLDTSRRNLPVRATKEGGFSADVVYRAVSDYDSTLAVIKEGSENKKMGESHLNDRSSRSHTIFRLRIRTLTEAGGGQKRTTSAELNLVDLAGSETLSSSADETNKKETSHINLSLTYLKKVIGELAHKASFISYRNSVLTKILKQALGGNSRTTVICCITPAAEHFKDSRNTLAFGTTAREVVLHAHANTAESGAAMNAAAREQLQKLQTQMLGMRSAIEQYQELERDYDEVAEDNEKLAGQVERLRLQLRKARAEIQALREGGAVPATTNTAAADDGGEAAPIEGGGNGQPQQHADPYAAGSSAGPAGEGDLDIPDFPDDAIDIDHHYDEDDFADVGRHHPDDTQDEGEFDDAFDVGSAPVAPDRELLSKAPKTRPDPNSTITTVGKKTPKISEAQVLRRELNRLRTQHREALQAKNEEMQRAVEEAQALAAANAAPSHASLIEEIPVAIQKDERVAALLDQIDAFLHYGTAFMMPLDAGKKGGLQLLHRHLYVSKDTDGKGNGKLIVCGLQPNGARDRSVEHMTVSFKDVKRVELGQEHEMYGALAASMQRRIDEAETRAASGTASDADKAAAEHEAKTTSELLTRLRRLQRCSFTVIAKKKKVLNVVCNNSADFEAWVVGLNRIISSSAEWPTKMNISDLPAIEELDDEETDFCSTLHISPKEYLRARTALFGPGPRLVTLFDIRAASGLDLYHAQRFFYFARCRGWVDSASVYFLSPNAVEQTFEEIPGAHESEFADDTAGNDDVVVVDESPGEADA